MTATQAAARLGLNAATVQRYCWAGQIKATHHGRDWWIEDAALDQFIEARQVGPGNKTGRPRRATPPALGAAPREETR